MKKTILLVLLALFTLASCSLGDGENPIIDPLKIVMQPNVGGPNEPNQAYVELGSAKSGYVKRSSWDFGFSSGTDFRVILNGSLKMAVKKLATSDISLVQVVDSNVAVGTGTTLSSTGYVDNPTGVLTGAGAGMGTAIAEVSANDTDNKVYLVNMGFAVASSTPTIGAVNVDGEARGWKKVRFLRNGDGYKIQYADLTSTTYTEKTITKDSKFNFSFFSLSTGNTVSVEPPKTNWDLNFTTFTNYMPGIPEVIYGDVDFVVTNRNGGTRVYQVLVADGGSYVDFTKSKVVEANFAASVTDQRIIGSNWRTTGSVGASASVKTDRFYVIKNAAGTYFKLRFLTLTNKVGARGYTVFEYGILK